MVEDKTLASLSKQRYTVSTSPQRSNLGPKWNIRLYPTLVLIRVDPLTLMGMNNLISMGLL